MALAAALVPNAVSAQVVLPTPALGAPPQAFESVFGAANDASIGALLHFQRCAGTDIDQLVLLAPNDQVWTIQRAWCQPAARPPEERFADAAQFLPADAVAGESFTTDEGESAQTFHSDSVASALPPGLFHDCSGNTVPPGTLVVVADSFGGWFMGPGTCP
jgi:hypothetical protein